MSIHFAPKPARLSSVARRGAHQKGLLSETAKILRSVDMHGRDAVMETAPGEIETLMSEQVDCERKGDVRTAQVLSGRIAAWRFQVGARRG